MEKRKEEIIEQINKAIAAHFSWKIKLKKAIDFGNSELSVENIKKDSVCGFGEWLYTMPNEYEKNEYYQNVKKIHANFHVVASKIVELAISGNKEKANKLFLDNNGDYVKTSTLLTLELAKWRDSF